MAGYNFEKPEEGRLAKGKSLTAQLGQRLQRHFAIPVEPEHDEFTLLLTKIKEKFDQQP